MFRLIIFSFVLFVSVIAQNKGSNPYSNYPEFYAEAFNYKGEINNKTRLDLIIEVPYSNLQFVKDKDLFRAEYSNTITVYDEDEEKIITEKIWKEKITATTYDATISEKNFNISLKNFNLPAGEYFIRITLYDNFSKKSFVKSAKINVINISGNLSLSDIMLVSKKEIDGALRYVPNIESRLLTTDKSLNFYFEAYSDKEINQVLKYEIENNDEDVIYSRLDTVSLFKGTNKLTKNITNVDFGIGKYKLIIKVLDKDGEAIIERNRNFVSQIYGFPKTIDDLDLAIKQMIYIAKEEIVDNILDIEDPKKREEAFIAYWKSKDPSPNTEENEILSEYYTRVEYADKHFKGYLKGWRSDMGMIYITLGPPDHIDRHPFDSDSKPYQVWEYYDINRSFVFVDETGFGDYRLINNNYRDWNSYRR